jgi:hypothetical protein
MFASKTERARIEAENAQRAADGRGLLGMPGKTRADLIAESEQTASCKTVIVHEIAPYVTSRNYARLAELSKAHSIICIVNYRDRDPGVGMLRDVASTHYSRSSDGSEMWQISARGTGYVWADNADDFARKCWTYDVEFIEPPQARIE